MRVSEVLRAWRKSSSVFDAADARTVQEASRLLESEELAAALDGYSGVAATQRALDRAVRKAEMHEGPKRSGPKIHAGD